MTPLEKSKQTLKKAVFVLTACLLLLNGGNGFAASPDGGSNGYRAVIGHGDGFVAAGSDGRIDRISLTGEIRGSERFPGASLNCLISRGAMIAAAGDPGILLIARDGKTFEKAESETERNIRSLALFQDYVVAGADGGVLFVGDEAGFFAEIPLEVKGNIVSLSTTDTRCYGVTDRGEILSTEDLMHWDIFNFNAFYAGYYPPRRFTGIAATDRQIAVTGVTDEGFPTLSLSSGGDVWSERSLEYTDEQGMPAYLTEASNAIFYDAAEDRFLLACDNGRVMSIPSCSHCNELIAFPTAESLVSISRNGDVLIVVGDKGYIGPIR